MSSLALHVGVVVGSELRKVLIDALSLGEKLSLAYVRLSYGMDYFIVSSNCSISDIDKCLAEIESKKEELFKTVVIDRGKITHVKREDIE